MCFCSDCGYNAAPIHHLAPRYSDETILPVYFQIHPNGVVGHRHLFNLHLSCTQGKKPPRVWRVSSAPGKADLLTEAVGAGGVVFHIQMLSPITTIVIESCSRSDENMCRPRRDSRHLLFTGLAFRAYFSRRFCDCSKICARSLAVSYTAGNQWS